MEKFVQLTDGPRGLHALGADGGVYRYIPEDKSKRRFAFWSRLTDHRAAASRPSFRFEPETEG